MWTVPGSALGSCPTARQGCGWEASAAIAAAMLWVTGLRFLQAGTHCRETPALQQARRVLRVLVCCMRRTPCIHVLAAEWKSFVHHDRFFPVSFLLGKDDVSETSCFLGKHVCGQKTLLPAQEHQPAVLSALSRLQTLPSPSLLAWGSGQVAGAVGLKPADVLVLLLLISVRCVIVCLCWARSA